MAKRLGELLQQEGLATEAQVKTALERQQSDGGFLGALLVADGVLDETALLDVLSRQPGVSAIDLDRIKPDPELATKIPEAVARRLGCVPIKLTGNTLQVGLADPLDESVVDQIHQLTGFKIRAGAVAPSKMETAWAAVYDGGGKKGHGKKEKKETDLKTVVPSGAEIDKTTAHAVQEISDAELEKDESEKEKGDEAYYAEIGPEEPPVVRLSNLILLKCIESGASDIHIEPQEEQIRVRYRIDGSLHQLFTLPVSIRAPLTSRFKIMSEMDVAEHRIPQDGRIKLQLTEDEDIDFRVNTLPGVLGEKICARILGTGMLKGRVADLGFGPEALENVENSLGSHFGMILVTGPTGSGKTTTLYTMLTQLNTEDVNIVTAEDPVEYNLSGIHQVNIRNAIGFTFDVALRSFLRQDPDIILVGEMRDYETAAIAVKAALTGHLVLSTLHTNDAPSTVVRLIDMGIEPYLVASAVKLVIAQRLVRKLCENCKRETPVGDVEKLDVPTEFIEQVERVFKGAGCETCKGIGHKGRLPVFEVMPVKSKEMRRVITEGGTEVQVSQVARREGLVTLAQAAITFMNDGKIDLDEAIKIALSE